MDFNTKKSQEFEEVFDGLTIKYLKGIGLSEHKVKANIIILL